MTINHDMLYHLFKFITHFGDPALLVPLSIAFVAALLWQNNSAAGLRFGLVVAADLTLILLSKLWFYTNGKSPELNIVTPSGHASLSVTFYGCVAIIFASQRRLPQQLLIVCAALLAVLAVTVSRIMLSLHTPEEVLFGTLIGGLFVAAFSVGTTPVHKFRLQLPIWFLVVLAVGSVSVWAIAPRQKAEEIIEHWGFAISSALRVL